MTDSSHLSNAAADRTSDRIVVGVDGSEESFAALSWALDDANRLDATINAVYGWTPSWEVGAEPDSKEAWDMAYASIESKISEWVQDHYPDAHNGSDRIILTSVRGSGQAALLTLGANSLGIVVGRRSLNAILRWFLGSTSASLAQAAKVPVTIVRKRDLDEDRIIEKHTQNDSSSTSVLDADALTAAIERGDNLQKISAAALLSNGEPLPIVVGIDGSSDSVRALQFAVQASQRTGRRLHIFFCWQMRDLGVVPGYENAVAPVQVAQEYAQKILDRSIASAEIPASVDYRSAAMHISPTKGLTSASNYAYWVIVGSRGLSGIDASVLGSVSGQLVKSSRCTLTVVH
jgi:nucleotide-binding universal stress UspA family protein